LRIDDGQALRGNGLQLTRRPQPPPTLEERASDPLQAPAHSALKMERKRAYAQKTNPNLILDIVKRHPETGC
jgi:hypothetical protein